MSGHSKWATIRHKKGAQDAKRGQIFSKIIKEITIAARLGGGDPEANPRLRTAVLKAKNANMPKDNVDRAIKKGSGELEGVNYIENTYEAYGPGGTALLIETLTDNRNRTAADVRSILTKGGGNMGESGCVSYLFKRKGVIGYSSEEYSEEQIMEAALEANAEDISEQDGAIEVTCEPDDFEAVLEALEKAGFSHNVAEITMLPDTTTELEPDATVKALKLIDKLEENDDVQAVHTNLELPEGFNPEEFGL